MKKTIWLTFIISFFTISIAWTQSPQFSWAVSSSGTSQEYGFTIDTDNSGNVYTSGHFKGTADFDPGPGNTNFTAAANRDIYIQKLDPSGNFIWASQLRADLQIIANEMVVDNAGNSYTTGYFQGTVDFDPGPGVSNLSSSFASQYVVKLDPNGNLVWVRALSSTNSTYGQSITLSQDQQFVYIGGQFRETTDFDPGPGTFNMVSTANNDGYVQKLDAAGNFVWAAHVASGTGWNYCYDMAVDANDDIILTGKFSNTADFDPGAGTSNMTANFGFNMYIEKLNSSGNLIWVKQMESTGNDQPNAICVDAHDNIYVTGNFDGTTDFDPGSGSANLIGAGGDDIFIQKLDANGNYKWAHQFGNANNQEGMDISSLNDYVFITGYFQGTLDFDPGSGTATYTPPSVYPDGFILKLDTLGDFEWAGTLSGPQVDQGNDLALDNGDVYVTGEYRQTVDFDPGAGTFNQTSTAAPDAFVLKLNQCTPSSSTINETACDSYSSPAGNTYTSTGTYVDVITNAGGCDSTITINLTINNSTTGTDVITACDSYTWIDGNTYNASNNSATHTLTNSVGCDSVVTLNLTINNSTTGTDIITACDSYTWIDGNTYNASNNSVTHTLTNSVGCDSVVTLNLTINHSTTGTDIITACDSYTWIDGNTYNASNNSVTHTLTNSVGCDSVVTLNLTINHSTTGTDIITACDSYTWIDGNTYNASNNSVTHTLTNSVGCDSVVTLNLTINNSTTGTDVITACDSYTWIDGNTYNASNNSATHTLTNAAGCDSVVTLNLTINHSTTGTDVITACDSYTWIDGNTYNASNNSATHTLTNSVGCDSVVTLNLTINHSTTGTDVITACDSYTWIDGNTYNASNNSATHTLTNSVGCDSVVTLNLTINHSTTGTDVITACDSYTWIDGNTYSTSNNSATHTLTNAVGCDSVVTLSLTINHSTTGTDIITACDSYTWIDGNTYNASNNSATHTLTNAVGCDSVVTLNLTINNSTTGTDVITACDSYTWIDGNTYTTSNNTATHTLSNANGCDSLVTLNLTINHSSGGTDVISACTPYTWIDGITYSTSTNTPTFTLSTVNGCDSLVTLDLTISSSINITDTQTGCDSLVWAENGVTYYASTNTPFVTYTAVSGCDSIITLDLTINHSSTGTDMITACDSFIWIDGNTYTTSNNVATHVLTNAVGCDSLVTLDLTILQSSSSTLMEVACGSYISPAGNTYTTSGTYIETILNAVGCDSTITIELTIENVDTSVSVVDPITLMSNDTGGMYQWLDCDNGYAIIPGATGQTFSASSNGNYAVQVSSGSCIDTSLCFPITSVGLYEKTIINTKVYPIPTTGDLNIELDQICSSVHARLYNASGQLIESFVFQQAQYFKINMEHERGLYFLELTIEGQRPKRVQVIKL